jgi:two-component system chemotaxis response regulator CheY
MTVRVLVADDARFMRQLIRDIIEPEGFEVVGEAADGRAAVEEFSRLQPDIVTMDIVMPKRSGIDAVKEILALDPSAKVAMVSALGQESLVTEALQAGASDYIVKPFKPDAVIETLRKLAEKAPLWISPSIGPSSSKRRPNIWPRSGRRCSRSRRIRAPARRSTPCSA